MIVNGDDDKQQQFMTFIKSTDNFWYEQDNAIWADHIENRGLLGSRADIHMGMCWCMPISLCRVSI